MKRIESVYREILYLAIEKNQRKMTQKKLSIDLDISLSIINLALKPLRDMNAVLVKPMHLEVIDIKKILYYWASIRNLKKDIIYSTRADKPVKKIESEMPSDILFTAYSGYKFLYKDVPADYSEVYVYGDPEEIKKRFPESKNTPNIIVLKKDSNLKKMTTAQIYVDLWNVKEWYAKDFLKSLEARFHGILE